MGRRARSPAPEVQDKTAETDDLRDGTSRGPDCDMSPSDMVRIQSDRA
jgi:hypothetical protein